MKKAKSSAGKAKRPQQMTKEELIATLLKKKQCNAKALLIVEGMLEGEVNPQWLLGSLQFIAQSHYQDAVEERAILKICGYPLCKNSLVNVPKQQYRISTQNNKVYDISERKNFCSNACYKSSTFLKDQIMTSPLWLRDIEKVPVYKLLEGNSTRSGAGDEIDLGPTRVTAEEASIGRSTLDEPEEKSLREDDSRNQLKIEESTQHVLSGDSAAPSQNGRDIPTKVKFNPPVSYEDNTLANTANEPVSRKTELQSKEQETKLPESKLSHELGSVCSRKKEAIVDKEEVDDSSKERSEPRKISCDSHSSGSHEVFACGGEGSSYSRDAGNVVERCDPRNAVENEKSAEESSIKSAVKTEKIEDRKQVQVSADRKPGVRKQKRPSRHASSTVPPVAMPSVSELVEKRLTEWFTVDSLCFLYGEQKTREMLGQLGSDLEQNFKPLDSATWDPEKHDRFVNICKRLNLLDLEDRSYDEKVINEDKNVVKKPLPDFNKLKEEAEKMDLRVQAFYKGQLELEPRKVTFSEDTKEESEEQELPVIPLVHQHEQRALRRRLVLDSLNRVLPDLLRTIGVHSSQVNSALRGLVGTFALTASNITFNPRHWTLVAIAIIKLLSVREARLHLALTSEASQKYLTLIQMSYNLGPTYLDLLMDRLVSSAMAPLKPAETR